MPTCTIKMNDCESHQLRRFGYDPERQVLAVMFRQGKDGADTSRPYEYPCAPEVHAGLCAADSKGKFFNTRIKGNASMPHTKVVETDEERAARKQAEVTEGA